MNSKDQDKHCTQTDPLTAASRHFLRSGGQMLYLDLAKNGRLAAERYL